MLGQYQVHLSHFCSCLLNSLPCPPQTFLYHKYHFEAVHLQTRFNLLNLFHFLDLQLQYLPTNLSLLLLIMASIARHLSTKALTRSLRALGFEEKLIRKFVKAPYNIEYATALLKSYSPPSRKPRKGRYNNLCLHKGARNQRRSIFGMIDCVSIAY